MIGSMLKSIFIGEIESEWKTFTWLKYGLMPKFSIDLLHPVNRKDLLYSSASPSLQALIQATDELMLEQTYVEGPLQSWLASFVTWANNTEYR